MTGERGVAVRFIPAFACAHILTAFRPEQVDQMLDEHGIYLTRDGRMSMAGMKAADVPVVARALVQVTQAPR